MLVTLLVACGPKLPPAPATAPYAEAALVGTWQNEGGGTVTIAEDKGRAVVVAIVDSDEEVFTVESYGWGDRYFAWTYTVPSTGFEVLETMIAVDGDTMSSTWSNQTGEEGTDSWTRR